MTSDKDVVATLVKRWHKASAEREKVELQIRQLSQQRDEIIQIQRQLLASFDIFGGPPLNLTIPTEVTVSPNASIGDLMASMLANRGPMTKAEILTELQKVGKAMGKNARTLLANAIKRDGEKRFAVKEGKVFLAEKSHSPEIVPLERKRRFDFSKE